MKLDTLPLSEKISLTPFQPVTVILNDQPVKVFTAKGRYVFSILLINNRVVIGGTISSPMISISQGMYSIVGTSAVGKEFFGEHGALVSHRHLLVGLKEILPDGSAKISLEDLNSKNGTEIECLNHSDDLEEEPMSVLSKGAEGEIVSPDQNVFALTTAGIRAPNQDGVSVSNNRLIIADGMGGHHAGGLASTAAIEIARKYFATNRNARLSVDTFERACRGIRNNRDIQGGGSTLLIVNKTEKRDPENPDAKLVSFEIGHVGDSKVYLISLSSKKIIAESKDQSVIQELIDGGAVPPLARWDSDNSVITNAIVAAGLKRNPQIFEVEGHTGDLIAIACSDGVSDFLTPEEILNYTLMQMALSINQNSIKVKALGKLGLGYTEKPHPLDPEDLVQLAHTLRDVALSRQNQEIFSVVHQGTMKEVESKHCDNISIGIMV